MAPEVSDMDPKVTPQVESSARNDPDETAGQQSESQRSAEEHDLQEGLSG